jgi:hypothetical protein
MKTSSIAVLGLTLSLTVPALTQAQSSAELSRFSVTAGLSLTTQTDDETNLGAGPLISVGVRQSFAGRFQWEAELSVARLRRDSGYLAASSTPIVGTGRLTYFFVSPERRGRPFVSAGASLTHHRGHFVWTHIIPGPGGLPVEGPSERHDWRLTKPGFEAGLGIELRGAGRLWFRPELRVSATTGNSAYRPGFDTLEAPILAIRGGLVIGW